jgi:uncharacterized membrane protein
MATAVGGGDEHRAGGDGGEEGVLVEHTAHPGLHGAAGYRRAGRRSGIATAARIRTAPFIAPGLLLGVGLGGFVDGIVFHQILQWHHLVSADEPTTTVAGLEANTLADGLFHASTWLLTAVGIWLLWRTARSGAGVPSGLLLLGLMLAGWGTFQLFDAVVNHHLLGLHNAKEGSGRVAANIGWIASGFVLLGAGLGLARRADR